MDSDSLGELQAALRGALLASPAFVVVREWMIVERAGEGRFRYVVLGLEAGDVWRRSSAITAREGAFVRTASGRIYELAGPPASEAWSNELRRGWEALETLGGTIKRVE